ncbi:MAG: transcription termination factor Rho, partial [Pseudonocardiales bacterium]|nr:transcription termination factor Rho [Pseudonocardiales bacterium]
VDIAQSSTRKEELLLTTKEMVATRALRRALDGRDSQQAIDMLLDGLRKTPTNAEFLTQLTRPTPHNGSGSGTAGR